MDRDREFLQFRIRAYTPETLPMGRLGEYLTNLAALYGSKEVVHFDRLLRGSVVVQSWVPRTESEFVVERLRSIKRGDPTEEVKRSYQRIDSMLRENSASADITRKGGGQILAFPGAKIVTPAPITVIEHAEVEGVVVRVGGVDKTIPVHLQAPSGEIFPCQVRDRAQAKEFAGMLYGDPIRVRGPGRWERGSDARWRLIEMIIEGWDTLDEAPLSESLERLRTIPRMGWKKVKDPVAELKRIREGS